MIHRFPLARLAAYGLAASSLAAAALLSGCAGANSASIEAPESAASEAKRIDDAAALVRQAQRFEVAEQDQKALDTYIKAIETYRELPVAWNNMGALLAKKGDRLKAAEAYITASELSPTDPRPLHNLGSLWEGTGELAEAAKWYDRALERDDSYLPSLRRRIGIDLLRDTTDEHSIERTRKALLLEKDPWWIDRFKRAEIRFRQSENAASADSMSK